MFGSWACLAWGVYRLCLAVKMLGGWANGFCGVILGLHWLCSAAWLFGGWANCSCGVCVCGRRSGEGLKAWVVKLLGGLSASAVHKEL